MLIHLFLSPNQTRQAGPQPLGAASHARRAAPHQQHTNNSARSHQHQTLGVCAIKARVAVQVFKVLFGVHPVSCWCGCAAARGEGARARKTKHTRAYQRTRRRERRAWCAASSTRLCLSAAARARRRSLGGVAVGVVARAKKGEKTRRAPSPPLPPPTHTHTHAQRTRPSLTISGGAHRVVGEQAVSTAAAGWPARARAAHTWPLRGGKRGRGSGKGNKKPSNINTSASP